MWNFAILSCVLIGTVRSGYSSTNDGGSGNYASAGAGASAGSYGGAYPFASYPSYGYGPAAIADFLAGLQAQQAASISTASSTGDSTAYATGSLAPNELFNQQFQHQAELFDNNNIGDRFGGGSSHGTGSVGGVGGGVGGSGAHFASSSASIGPGGGHQTAFISPPNPRYPNVNTRFGASSGGGPGHVGVSTSSFSSTKSDGTSQRGAFTSVNDNGKVSTYYTRS